MPKQNFFFNLKLYFTDEDSVKRFKRRYENRTPVFVFPLELGIEVSLNSSELDDLIFAIDCYCPKFDQPRRLELIKTITEEYYTKI